MRELTTVAGPPAVPTKTQSFNKFACTTYYPSTTSVLFRIDGFSLGRWMDRSRSEGILSGASRELVDCTFRQPRVRLQSAQMR